METLLTFFMPRRSKKPKTDSPGPNREAPPVSLRPRIFRYLALLRIRIGQGKNQKEYFARDEDVDAAAKVRSEHIPLCNFVGDLRTEAPLTIHVRDLAKARLKWDLLNLQGGFTFVELMCVVAALAILASLAVPGALAVMKRNRGRACQSNLQLIEAAKVAYWQEHRAAPPENINDANGIRQYLPNRVVPICPSGGTYNNTTAVATPATCTSSNTAENPDFNAAVGAAERTPPWQSNGYHNLGR